MPIIATIKNTISNITRRKPTNKTTEIGVGYGADIAWSKDEIENPDNLKPKDYIEMQKHDGEVKALVKLLSLPIQSANIDIVPAEEDSGEAEFIEDTLLKPKEEGGMSTPIGLVVADMCRAISEGFRLYEKVFEIVDEGQYKGKLKLRKLAPRDAQTITLKADNTGGFDGAVQRVNYKGESIEVELPKERCLLYTHNKEKNWLYGESDLKSAWYHYDKKHKLMFIMHKMAELGAFKMKHVEVPNTSPLSDGENTKLNKALRSLGFRSNYIRTPDGVKINFHEPVSKQDIVSYINYHDQQMAKSVLAQFINMGQDGVGSYALSKDHTDIFMISIRAIMNNIESTINSYLIPQLIDYNFSNKQYPKFKFEDLTENTKELMKDIFYKIVEKRPEQMPEGFISEMIKRVADDLDIEYDDEIVEQPEVSEQKPVKEPAEKVEATENGKKKILLADILKREPNKYEARYNLIDLNEKWDALDKIITIESENVLNQQKEAVELEIRESLTNDDWIKFNNIKFDPKPLTQTLISQMKRGIAIGKQVALQGKDWPIPETSKATIRKISLQAEYSANKICNDLTNIIKSNLLDSIVKQEITLVDPETIKKFMYRIDDQWAIYKDRLVYTGALLSSRSINEGKAEIAGYYGGRIDRFQYSAIMDDRTCAYCEALDGLVIKVNDGDYYNYMPPQHIFCRCLDDTHTIKTKGGDKNIKDIKAGDYVLTHKNRYKKVMQTSKRKANTLFEIETESGHKLRCTPEHPILTKTRGWVEAKDLTCDDELFSLERDGTFDKARYIKQVPFDGYVYNFAVENDESYIANDIIVHNCFWVEIYKDEEDKPDITGIDHKEIPPIERIGDLPEQFIIASTAKKLYNIAKEGGGFTIDYKGRSAKSGYAYAPSKSTELKLKTDIITREMLADYIDKYKDVLINQKGFYIGGWAGDGEITMDISTVGKDNLLIRTIKKAYARKQDSIWDLKRDLEVKTPYWYESKGLKVPKNETYNGVKTFAWYFDKTPKPTVVPEVLWKKANYPKVNIKDGFRTSVFDKAEKMDTIGFYNIEKNSINITTYGLDNTTDKALIHETMHAVYEINEDIAFAWDNLIDKLKNDSALQEITTKLQAEYLIRDNKYKNEEILAHIVTDYIRHEHLWDGQRPQKITDFIKNVLFE